MKKIIFTLSAVTSLAIADINGAEATLSDVPILGKTQDKNGGGNKIY